MRVGDYGSDARRQQGSKGAMEIVELWAKEPKEWGTKQ